MSHVTLIVHGERPKRKLSQKMSTKLKRTPLFGQDGHLGLPIIANNNKHKLQVG